MIVETCFACGSPLIKGICSNCKFKSVLEDICPRKVGCQCVHTKKICSITEYESCSILRKFD